MQINLSFRILRRRQWFDRERHQGWHGPWSYKKKKMAVQTSHWQFQRGVRNTRALGQISFTFIQLSGKVWPNNRLAPDICSWCPPSRKCWISRWIMYLGLQQYIDPLLILLVLHFRGRKSLYLSNWSRNDPSSVNDSAGNVPCNGDGWEGGVLKVKERKVSVLDALC